MDPDKRNQRTVKRFESRVDRDGPIPERCPELGPCHVWTASVDHDGYGRFYVLGKTHKAPRVAFFLANGRWPEPCALHRCDNRACVNVEHLFEGDDAVNMADRDAKQRQARGERHGSRTQPHRVPRGERHGLRLHPERAKRGEDNPRSKLTEQDVRDIRANYALCRVSKKELGARFGVSDALVGNIIRRKIWAHV